MRPHRRQPTRLRRPRDSPGKNTGVGCHFLLQWMKVKSENWKWSHSVLSDPQQPHGLQPTRFLCPWDFPGKSTGARCHCLLREHHWCFENILDLYWWILFASSCKVSPVRQGTGKKDYARNYLKTESILFCFSSVQFSSVAQSCPTLCDPMNCSTPGLPVHHQLLEFTQIHIHRVIHLK